MNSTARARAHMVDQQLRARGIADARVLSVMEKVPRELFVGEALAAQAYHDSPLPIGEKQTISQPFIVARMLEALNLKGTESVLEIGTGSGYMTAILAGLVSRVYTIERHGSLSLRARSVIEGMGLRNVVCKSGDGTLGWREFAPFDAIVISAAGPDLPAMLGDQLVIGGRLVMPLGGPDKAQVLYCYTRTPEGMSRNELGPVRFVPLIGRFGWDKRTVGD